MLNGKQKRQLKQLAQRMPDTANLGKAGITPAVVSHLGTLLDRQELIKLRFTDVTGTARKALANEVAAACNADVIAIVGHTLLLYRDNPELEANKKALSTK